MEKFLPKRVALLVLLLLGSLELLAAPPSVTAVFMTGSMKDGHTLTINYTYVPNPNPELGTTFQWFRYDDNFGTNPFPIPLATGATYTLTAADVGRHIGCVITPRDNAGVFGAPFTFQPWSGAPPSPLTNIGPNTVLPNGAGCLKADGIGVPVPGNLILNPSFLCSPRTLDWQIDYTGINYSIPLNLLPRVTIDWGDGAIQTVAPVLTNAQETNMAKQTWRVTTAHIFDYSAGSTASTVPGSRCTYTMATSWAVGTFTGVGYGTVNRCDGLGVQTQPFTVWDTEDSPQPLGQIDIEHDATSTGVQTIPPVPLPPSNENVNVCEDDTNFIRLIDNTDFNCTPALENPQPNDRGRWVQWVYGTAGTNITAPGGAGGSIIINGVSYSAAQLPVFGRPEYIVAPTLGPSGVITDNIQMPPTATPNQQFFVTMRSWNICNAFDRNTADGCGLNPPQGGVGTDVFNIYGVTNQGPSGQVCEPALTVPFFANNNPVTRLYTITIIDSPNPPVVPDRDICFAESRTISVTPVIVGLTYEWYTTMANAVARTGVINTGATFTPSNAQAPVGITSFFVVAVAANNCFSPPEEVRITRRPDLPQPPAFSTAPTDICPNSTYTYALPIDPATEVPGGITEYIWTVPAGWTLNSGQGTRQISVTSNAVIGASTLQVRRRYVTPTSNGTQCTSPPRNVTVNIRPNPTASITPNVIDICAGSTLLLDGNPTNTFGTISSHLWTGNSFILDNANIQQPTILATTPAGVYNLTYTVTNSIGCSGSDVVTVNVSPNPGIATTGPNQALCGTLTSNAMGGSAPGPGTGTWTFVSSAPARPAPTISNINDPNATITITAGNEGAYTMRWTVVSGTCTSAADIIVDLGSTPTPSNAGANFAACGETTNLSANTPIIGGGNWTVISGPGACVGPGCPISIVTPNSPTSQVDLTGGPAFTYGAYTLRWTITSGTCPSSGSDVVVTFNRPATAAVGADFTTCVDQLVFAPIAITGTVGGGSGAATQQGRWEIVSGGGTFVSNAANPGGAITGPTINDSYTPTAADFAAGTIVLRLVALDPDAAGPCTNVNSPTNLTITIDRKPTNAVAGLPQSICTNSTTLTATPVNNGGLGTWSTAAVGVVFSDINSPTATVSNLPSSGVASISTTLTWTVSSALSGNVGACANSTSDVVITVNPLPLVFDPAPQVCELMESSSIRPNVDLTTYNDGVTGIAGSTDRTVLWYNNLPRTPPNLIASPTNFTVGNGQILYTTVTTVSTTCTANGQVTFTVNPLPAANDLFPEICEDLPVGSNNVDNVDLTFYDDQVFGVATPNRAVTWFTDATYTTLVPDATDVDGVSDTDQFFARVRNTVTNCENDATLTFTVNPRPVVNPIAGPNSVCADAAAVVLYQVTTVNPGSTYVWNIPQGAGEFVQFAGGGVNDFFVLINFPNVVSPGLDISVTEFSIDGCPGVTEILNITVESSPPPITVVGPLSVCANETGVVYSVANLPNTTFAWSVPVGASIIGGQGTNTITVNFGGLSGNVSVLPTTTTGCPGNPDSDFVTVNQRPILDPLLNATNCSNDLAGIIFDVATGSVAAPTYNITAVNVDAGLFPVTGPTSGLGLLADAIANDEFENLTGGPLNVRYTVIPVSAEGCEGAPRTVTLTVRPEPTLDANLGVSICSQEATGVIFKVATGSFPADQFQIVSINSNGLIASAGNPTVGVFGPTEIADDAWINTTAAPVTVIYSVRPINSSTGCIGDPPQPLNIIINPEPVAVPNAETICSGFSPILTLTSSLPGSTFTWTVKNVTGIVIGASSGTGNKITDVLVNNSGAVGAVTYEVVATGTVGLGSCISQPVDVVITVESAPSVNNIVQTVCSDGAGGNTSVTDLVSLQPSINNVGGVTFAWFQDAAFTIPINAPQVNAYPLANGIPVFARVSNGTCNNRASVTYTVNPLPSVAASAPQFNGFEITCNGANNGRITAVASQGTPPYLYSIDGGANFFPTATFNSLLPNIYTITVRDSKGCIVNSAPITIDEPPLLTITPNVIIDPTCRGTSTGSIQALALGGVVGTYSYSINGGPFQASDLFSNLSAGLYTITVRDANNCTANANATVTDPLQLTGSITGQINVNCNGNNSGSVTVEGAGGTAPFTYAIDGVNFQGSGTFASLPAGAYTITVRDNNNCITPVFVNITQPAILALNLASKTDVLCNGTSTGAISVAGSGGTAPYAYAIDGINFTPTADFTGLPSGPQTITVRDANLCVATLNVIINQPSAITGSVTSQTNVDCFGNNTGAVTVNGSGGSGSYLFSIDGGAFGSSGTFSGLMASNYVVTIQDQNNCTTNVPVTITQPTALGGSIVSTTNVLCAGGNSGVVEVVGSGGSGPYQYSINAGVLFTANPSFIGLTAGNYSIIVRDNNLCVFTIPVTITEPLPLAASISAQSPVDCKNNATGSVTVTATGGSTPYAFSIDGSNFQATGTFGLLAAGNYIVRVRDANACTQNVNVTITEPPQLVVALQSRINVDCNGNNTGSITVNATGGVGGYTYSSDGVNFVGTPTFTGYPAGTHTLFARDINNCQAQVDVVITEPLVLVLNVVSTTDVLCNGQNTGSITVAASGGAGSYEYSRDGFIFSPLNVFFGLQANNYNITVRDGNGCTTSQLVTINEPAALTASTTQTANILCYLGADAALTINTSGGVGVLRFLLLEDPANSTGLFSGVFTGIRAGTYTIRVTDDNGCSVVTTPIVVNEPTQLQISAQITSNYNGFSLSCEGASDARIEALATGGTGAYTYTLLNPGIVASNATGVFDLLPSGNYTVQVQDINSCLKLSLPVLIFDPFPFSPGFIGFNQAICQGDNPALIEELVPPFGGIGNYQYQWQESLDGVTFSTIAGATNATFTPPSALLQTTFYKRIVTTGTCLAEESNSVQITVNPLPTVVFTAPAEVCEGDFFLLEFNFTGTPPFRFDYDDGINVYNNNVGNFYTPVPIFNFATTTTFNLTRVVDINGCVIFPNQSVTVNVSKIDPTFSIVGPTAQCSGSTFSFQWTVSPDVEYTWVFGDGAQQIVAPNTLPVGLNTIDHIFTSLVPSTSINFPVILRAENLANGCGPKQTNQAITVFPSVAVNVLPSDNAVCSGESVNFNNLTQGANTHRWFYRVLGNVGQELDVRTTPSVDYTFTNTTTQNPITYEIVYVGSNTNGCSDGISFNVDVFREITADFDEGIVPPFVGGSASVTFTNTSVPIDGGAFSYDWSFGTDATPATQNGVGPFPVTYSSFGTKTIRLDVTNIAAQAAGENCVSSVSKVINLLLPPLTAGFRAIPLKACFPTTIEVVENTSTGDIFQWQVFDEGGRLVATSNAPLPEFRIVNPGTYDIFLQTTNSISGQSAFAQLNGIEVYDQPQAAFEVRPKTFFVPDTELTTFNFTNGASQYEWDFGDGGTSMDFEPTHVYTLEGKYEIVLVAGFDHGNHDVDGDGVLDGNIVCYDTARIEVTGRQGGLTKIPNAFTPNPNGPNGGIPGNGSFNDVFLPITRGVEEFEMQIYDRWGNLIFESRDKNQGWDGYDKNGRLLPSGVYVFKLILRLSDGQRTTQIGDVTLIR